MDTETNSLSCHNIKREIIWKHLVIALAGLIKEKKKKKKEMHIQSSFYHADKIFSIFSLHVYIS